MSNRLYECADDVCRLLNSLDNGEDISPDTIQMVIDDFADKAQDVIAYSLNLDAQIELLDAHIKKMQVRSRVLKNKCKNINNYIFNNMQRTGIKKIVANNGSFTASIRQAPVSVEIYDQSLLPEALVRTKVISEPDKVAIKDALKNGEDVQGARLVSSEVLSIK